eukprot:7565551-Pyramimonas_sp.AAC.1
MQLQKLHPRLGITNRDTTNLKPSLDTAPELDGAVTRMRRLPPRNPFKAAGKQSPPEGCWAQNWERQRLRTGRWLA